MTDQEREEKIRNQPLPNTLQLQDREPEIWFLLRLLDAERTKSVEAERRGREQARNPCDKIFSHKWLDPNCVENGCQSLLLGPKP